MNCYNFPTDTKPMVPSHDYYDYQLEPLPIDADDMSFGKHPLAYSYPCSMSAGMYHYSWDEFPLAAQNPAAQGKRQRRQAAATLVQNFPSWTGVGKKSKAQPRPVVQIPPRGIGPVAEPNQNDVLCGRGGR
jgi:hypothetical protein